MKRRILSGPVTPVQQVVSTPVHQAAPPIIPPAPPVAVQAPPAPPVMPTMQQQIQQAVDTPPPTYTAPPAMPTAGTYGNTITYTLPNQQVHQAPPAQQATTQHYVAPVPIPTPAQMTVLHSLDMGTDDVSNFRQIPENVWVEAEITKSEMKTSSNGNPMIALQLKATWPNEYAGCVVWDQVVITQASAWKYKSICAACVDEEGNRLLSEDNRRFIGKNEQDFVGNVVRFRSAEATVNENGSIFNKVKGGYQQAFETSFDDANEEVLSGDNGNIPVAVG